MTTSSSLSLLVSAWMPSLQTRTMLSWLWISLGAKLLRRHLKGEDAGAFQGQSPFYATGLWRSAPAEANLS